MKFTQWNVLSILTKVYNHHHCLILEHFHHLSSNLNKITLVGWRHWLNGHEFEKTQGDSEGQGSLACCIHGVAKSWTRLNDSTTTYRYTTCCLSVSWLILFPLLKFYKHCYEYLCTSSFVNILYIFSSFGYVTYLGKNC